MGLFLHFCSITVDRTGGARHIPLLHDFLYNAQEIVFFFSSPSSVSSRSPTCLRESVHQAVLTAADARLSPSSLPPPPRCCRGSAALCTCTSCVAQTETSCLRAAASYTWAQVVASESHLSCRTRSKAARTRLSEALLQPTSR